MASERCVRVTLLAAFAVLLAGCGGDGGPHLAHGDAAPLISLSHRIAGEGACAQARDIRALQRGALRLVNSERIPRALEETFLSGVNALAATSPACVPPAAIAPATVTPSRGRRHKEHGEHKEHGD